MTERAPFTALEERLSIVVPARNEAASVQQVLRALREVFPQAELLLVDNGSHDGTAELAAQIDGVKVVLEMRPGKGRAMRTGAAIATGEFLLFHDADTEYDVRDAALVVERAYLTRSCVIGVRLVSFDALKWSSWLANWLIQQLLRLRFGARVADVLSGTRCLPRADFISLRTTSEGFGIETEQAAACLKKGLPIHYANVRYTPRGGAQGKKIRSYHLLSLVRIALR